MNSKLLHKPNQLINLTPEKKITTTERKAYNVMLKYAQNKLKFEDHKRNTFKMPKILLHKKANLKNDDNEYIFEKLEKLMSTVVRIYEGDELKSDNWKASFTLLSYFGKCDDGVNYEFELNHFIMDALKNQTYFTALDLIRINSLDSQYSIIFYEAAIEYEKVEIPKMSVERIRKLTNTEDQYKRFEALRRRVLNPACEEITEKTDINLSYDTEKIGRRISHIKFNVEKKPEVDLTIEEDQEYSEKVLKLFDLLPDVEQIDSNKEGLKKLIKDYDFEMIKADIQLAKMKSPDDFMAFLITSCKDGHWGKFLLEQEKKMEEVMKSRNPDLSYMDEEDKGDMPESVNPFKK